MPIKLFWTKLMRKKVSSVNAALVITFAICFFLTFRVTREAFFFTTQSNKGLTWILFISSHCNFNIITSNGHSILFKKNLWWPR